MTLTNEEIAKTIAYLVTALNINIHQLTDKNKMIAILNKVHLWVSGYSTDDRAIAQEILYELAH